MLLTEVQKMAQGYDYSSALANALRGFDAIDGLTVNKVFEDLDTSFDGQSVIIADLTVEDGTQRVAMYRNNAETAIDCIGHAETIKDFADGWYSNNGEETPAILMQYVNV